MGENDTIGNFGLFIYIASFVLHSTLRFLFLHPAYFFVGPYWLISGLKNPHGLFESYPTVERRHPEQDGLSWAMLPAVHRDI